MATIGRSSAVAQIGRLQFSGWLAWASWLLVHLLFLIGFRNKAAVLLQWIYSYLTYTRGARIITRAGRLRREEEKQRVKACER
jgi:NADH dehydrogenase